MDSELTSTEKDQLSSTEKYYTYKIIENKTVEHNTTPKPQRYEYKILEEDTEKVPAKVPVSANYDYRILDENSNIPSNYQEVNPSKYEYKIAEQNSTPNSVDLNQTPTQYGYKIVDETTPLPTVETIESSTEKLKKFAYKLLEQNQNAVDLNSKKVEQKIEQFIKELPTRPHGHPVNFGYPDLDLQRPQVDFNYAVDPNQYPIDYDNNQYVVSDNKFNLGDLSQYPEDPYEAYSDYDQPAQFDYGETYQSSSTEERPFKNFVDHVKFTFDYDRNRPTTQKLVETTTEKPKKYSFEIVSTEKPQLSSTTEDVAKFTYGLISEPTATKTSIRNYVDDNYTEKPAKIQITSTRKPILKYEYDLLENPKSVDFEAGNDLNLPKLKYSFGTIQETSDNPEKSKYSFGTEKSPELHQQRPKPIAYNSKPVDENSNAPRLKYTYGILQDSKNPKIPDIPEIPKHPKSVDFNHETNKETTEEIIEKLKYSFKFLEDKEKATEKSSFKFESETTEKPKSFKFPVVSTPETVYSTLYRWDKDEEHEHATEKYELESTSLQDLEASPTGTPNTETTLGKAESSVNPDPRF